MTMEHHEPSALLAAAETVHWIALAVMAIVYSVRLWWLHQFRNARGHTEPLANSHHDELPSALHLRSCCVTTHRTSPQPARLPSRAPECNTMTARNCQPA